MFPKWLAITLIGVVAAIPGFLKNNGLSDMAGEVSS